MFKKTINSNFSKLLFILIFILIIEFILIYRGYKQNSSKIYDLNIKNCVTRRCSIVLVINYTITL